MSSTHFERNLQALACTGPRPALWEALVDHSSSVDQEAVTSRPERSPAFDIPDDADVLFLGSSGVGCFLPFLEQTASRVVLVEPDLTRLSRVLAREDLSDPIHQGRFVVYSDLSPKAVVRNWLRPEHERAMSRLLFIDGAGKDRARQSYFAEVRNGIADRERDSALDTGAMVSLGPIVVDNALSNIAGSYPSLPPRLLSCFRGRPGIVVSAGPSLDENAVRLAEAVGRAVIIAVDTAVKPLARHGVRADLVVGVDPRVRNVHNLVGADLSASYLVTELSAHPALAALPAAGVALVTCDNPIGRVAELLGLDCPRLAMFGSVATAAFELSSRMGLDPIVLMGQDLAFTHGKQYCSNTDKRSFASAPDAEVRWETDIHGQPVSTTLRLQSFRDWLEARMEEYPKTTYVNATGAGILKQGVIQMQAEEALDHCLTDVFDVHHEIGACFGDSGTAESPTRMAALEKLSAEVEQTLAMLSPAKVKDVPATLRAYLRYEAVVALVEVLEARALLDLSGLKQRLPVRTRDRSLVRILLRGVERLEESIGNAMANGVGS